MSTFPQDLKYAARTLAHSPGYTAVALLSLALGIGANTAIFTLTNSVFLHPLPVKDPSNLLAVFTVDHATRTSAPNLTRTPVSLPNFTDYRERNHVFSGMSSFIPGGVTLTGSGKPEQENVFLVSANYFDVLGVPAHAGRVFRPDDDKTPGGNTVTVLSYSLARRLFGSASGAVGRSVNFNKISYDVVGIAPPNFKGTLTLGAPDVAWIPISMHAQVFSGIIEQYFNHRRFRVLNAFGRLRPGISPRQADAELRTVSAALEAAYPGDNRGRTTEIAPLSEAALGFLPRGQTTAAAVALSAAVGFVLLIACANIANLSLARATKRAREMGVRIALGANRARIVRQLLTEAELLAISGGAIGVVIGWFGAKALWGFRPAFLQQSEIPLNIDWRVCLFTLAISILTGLFFGIAPVLRAAGPDLSQVLNAGGRGNIQGGAHNRLRGALVVCEMALALVALAGAGLFIRSMQRAQQIDLGFETRNLGLFFFDLSSERLTPQRGEQMLRALVEKMQSVPGVAAASVSGSAPLGGGGFLQTAFHEGDPVDSRLGTLVDTLPVSSEYFDVMRIPLERGRLLNKFDRESSKPVMVISHAMARSLWPDQEAIGKRIHFATSPALWEVVGVVKDSTVFQVGEQPQPVVYFPFDQSYQPGVWALVRTSGKPDRVLSSVMAAVQSSDRDLALLNPATMQVLISQALWAPHMAAALFGLFGILSMVLAVIGVYGVMAYIVLQRTTEIGIRMALGAHFRDVMSIIVSQSMRLALIGIAVGFCAALALTRLVGNLLYDVSPNDPVTFIAVAVILASTAFVAGAIPAWRAARIDPVTALRQQ